MVSSTLSRSSFYTWLPSLYAMSEHVLSLQLENAWLGLEARERGRGLSHNSDVTDKLSYLAHKSMVRSPLFVDIQLILSIFFLRPIPYVWPQHSRTLDRAGVVDKQYLSRPQMKKCLHRRAPG